MALVEQQFDRRLIERIILELGDAFEIRIAWNRNTAVFMGVFTVAGGLVGGYFGRRIGAALGAGIGGATGYGVSTMISLREIWDSIKDKLKELLFVVFNFLRQLDPLDYVHGFDLLMACGNSRRELVRTMVEFIASKLSREVICSITAG